MNHTCRDAYAVYLQHAGTSSAAWKVTMICELLEKIELRCVYEARHVNIFQLETIRDMFEGFIKDETLSEEHQLRLMCHIVSLPIGTGGTKTMILNAIMGFVRNSP